MTFREVRDCVIVAAQSGKGLDEIDEEFITPSGLPEDEQAAAWIIARAEIAELEDAYARRQRGFRRGSGLMALGTD